MLERIAHENTTAAIIKKSAKKTKKVAKKTATIAKEVLITLPVPLYFGMGMFKAAELVDESVGDQDCLTTIPQGNFPVNSPFAEALNRTFIEDLGNRIFSMGFVARGVVIPGAYWMLSTTFPKLKISEKNLKTIKELEKIGLTAISLISFIDTMGQDLTTTQIQALQGIASILLISNQLLKYGNITEGKSQIPLATYELIYSEQNATRLKSFFNSTKAMVKYIKDNHPGSKSYAAYKEAYPDQPAVAVSLAGLEFISAIFGATLATNGIIYNGVDIGYDSVHPDDWPYMREARIAAIAFGVVVAGAMMAHQKIHQNVKRTTQVTGLTIQSGNLMFDILLCFMPFLVDMNNFMNESIYIIMGLYLVSLASAIFYTIEHEKAAVLHEEAMENVVEHKGADQDQSNDDIQEPNIVESVTTTIHAEASQAPRSKLSEIIAEDPIEEIPKATESTPLIKSAKTVSYWQQIKTSMSNVSLPSFSLSAFSIFVPTQVSTVRVEEVIDEENQDIVPSVLEGDLLEKSESLSLSEEKPEVQEKPKVEEKAAVQPPSRPVFNLNDEQIAESLRKDELNIKTWHMASKKV